VHLMLNYPSFLSRNRSLRPSSALVVLGLLAASTFASAASLCVNPNGKAPCTKTISAAVAAALPGDVITVAYGTYAEQVTITKSLSLVAGSQTAPIINATGLNNGIFINGLKAAPASGVGKVIIDGFRVENANFEGILVANASTVTLLNNFVTDNNRALVSGTCPGLDTNFETSEESDCGEGIHFIAVDHSTIYRNTIQDNSGGVLITDETGPSTSNLVKENIVQDNGYACGITMASHPQASKLIPSAKGPYGISHNVIAGNDSNHNGLKIFGGGAGVGIFAPGPGNVNSANVVIGNNLHQNGLPGVTMHNHAFVPGLAVANMNDNVIVGNQFSQNAADTADAATAGPTGINIYSQVPITGTVISGNSFTEETIDINYSAPSGQLDVHLNNFNESGQGIVNLSTGAIDATLNWWNCATGPGAGCATVNHPNITTVPFLDVAAPFTPITY
jgi:parallel beta-helix repeat protein